ncbi:MAG: hypothetical protein ACM3Q1_05525 [Bacteroidales bacterium]
MISAFGADTLPQIRHGRTLAFCRLPGLAGSESTGWGETDQVIAPAAFIRPGLGVSRSHNEGLQPSMSKIAAVLVVLVLAVIVGGGIFLATFDLPPPAAKIEKVIPDEKLPR